MRKTAWTRDDENAPLLHLYRVDLQQLTPDEYPPHTGSVRFSSLSSVVMVQTKIPIFEGVAGS